MNSKLRNKIIKEIKNERERQISVEGWSPSHDDKHDKRELATAAACYAGDRRRWDAAAPVTWPWGGHYWKPKDPRSDLIRAAALIVAELERLDRAALQQEVSDENDI